MYLTQSLADYRQDFEELHYLLTDCINRLHAFLTDIRRTKKYIARATYEEMTTTASRHIAACRTQKTIVMKKYHSIRHWSDEESLKESENIKKTTYEFLRTHQTFIGALITSTDWQSPTFLHSIQSQAGRQTGTIYGTLNDYKRDQHWDAYHYEQKFLKANIDGFFKLPIQIYATNSGMAAFTTILNYLLLEKKVSRPILMGKSIYFENKALVTRMFGDMCIEVDEADTDAVIHAIQTHNPSVIVFDSLTNSPDVIIPNLTAIIQHLVTSCKKETFLVIDNSCLSVTLQLYPQVFAKWTKLRLIVFESLNKHHQFGMDRVTGGIIWGYGGNIGKLFEYRDHLGTIISDFAAAALPIPNKKILTKRLMRHERNALVLATRLTQWIDDHPEKLFAQIMYPGLSNHPSYSWKENISFSGSYLAIKFKKQFQTIPSFKRFVHTIMREAKRQRVDLVSGTSFGMNTTRIYLTATRSKPNTPFIRIAVGTESRQAIEAVAAVFIRVLEKFR